MESLNHSMPAISLLCVEDDPSTRATISSVVSKKFPQMMIRTAENGEEGLKLFTQYRPDIVLTDISMPIMDGIQMARSIRALNSGANIVAASALSDTQYLFNAINIGISQYVLKPINFKLLFEALEACITRIDSERKIKTQNDFTRKLSSTVEQSPNMVMITDQTGAVEYVNPKFTEITGYQPEEISGQNLLNHMTNASPLDTFEAIWSTIKGGSEWRGEIINRKKDGELYREEISLSALSGEKGEITNFVAVMEDISTRKLTEEEAPKRELSSKQPDAAAVGSRVVRKTTVFPPRKQKVKL